MNFIISSFSLFILFTTIFFGSCSTLVPDRHVGLVVQLFFVDEPEFSRALVDSLDVVDLVQLPIAMKGNSSNDINYAMGCLESWLNTFKGYNINLQTYCGRIGYYTDERPFHLQYNLTTLSMKFFEYYYGNLTNLLANYSNVVLMIGFNEPYLHFDEEDVPTLLQWQYETWKNLTDIPFSVEFSSPLLILAT